MLGPKQEAQGALFYEFSLEEHVLQDHLLRSIDRFVDLNDIRQYLAEFYRHTGRPSIDPELLIRMLLVGYCFGIRSERPAPCGRRQLDRSWCEQAKRHAKRRLGPQCY